MKCSSGPKRPERAHQELGGLAEKSPKSLMRMFGPNGNPQARNFFEVTGRLQEREGLHLKVEAIRWDALLS